MILDESLKARWHVKNVFLLLDGEYDGGDLLLEIVLNQLDVDFHLSQIK